MTMKVSERKDLEKIINSRFDLLDLQIHERERELIDEATRQLVESTEKDADKLTAEYEKLQKELDSVVDKIKAFEKKCKDAELAPGHQSVETYYPRSQYTKGKYGRRYLKDDAKPSFQTRFSRVGLLDFMVNHSSTVKRVELRRDQGYEGEEMNAVDSTVEVTEIEFLPVDMEDKVKERIKAIKRDRGLLGSSLEEKRIEIIEDLLKGELESEDAKKFLEKVPNIDSLLPATLNGNGRELPAGDSKG